MTAQADFFTFEDPPILCQVKQDSFLAFHEGVLYGCHLYAVLNIQPQSFCCLPVVLFFSIPCCPLFGHLHAVQNINRGLFAACWLFFSLASHAILCMVIFMLSRRVSHGLFVACWWSQIHYCLCAWLWTTAVDIDPNSSITRYHQCLNSILQGKKSKKMIEYKKIWGVGRRQRMDFMEKQSKKHGCLKAGPLKVTTGATKTKIVDEKK